MTKCPILLLTDQIHIRQVCKIFFYEINKKISCVFYELPEGAGIASATHQHLGNIFLNIIWLAGCLDPWDNKGLQDVIYFQTEHHSYEAQYRMNLRLDWQGWPPSPQYTLQNSVQRTDSLVSFGHIIIIIQYNSNYNICVILLNLVYSRTYWLLTPPLKIVIFNWTSVSVHKQFWSAEKTKH